MAAAVQIRKTVAENWWVFLLEGVAALILGILLLTSPGATLAVIVTYIGVYWLISGIFSLVNIFVGDRRVPWWSSLLSGVIGILAGIFILNHPLLSAVLIPTVLVLVLAIQGLLMGAIKIVQAFSGAGVGVGIVGVLNILLGIFLLVHPLVGVVVLPIVLGAFALVGGIALIVDSFALHGMAKA